MYHPQHPPQQSGGPMSEEDYHQLERTNPTRKYEYLDGIARMMSGGSIEHDRIARNVIYALDEQLLSGPCTPFGSDVQVLLGIKSNGKSHYVYPDATVSCDVADRRRGNKLIRSPRIVFEVLSPSTEQADRGAKLKAYQSCPTIQEIVLINQYTKRVEVYQRDGEDNQHWQYTVYEQPEDTILLTSIDVPLTMAEIYKNINFDEPLLDE